MLFDLQKSIEVLEKIPDVLRTMLSNLSPDWTYNNEGGESWSPYDVIGHLIHGEKTDWIVRTQLILSNEVDKTFQPFDRFAQLNEGAKKTLLELLDEFQALRETNLSALKSMNISAANLEATGIHPVFGKVTLSQLLACWTVHDLGHLVQISRVMAKQYKDAVGPWMEYLSVLHK